MKKHISALLALSMILLLSACGGQSQSQDSSGSLSSEAPESSQSGNEQQSTQSDAAQEFLSSITPETAEAKGVCGADLYWYYQDNVLVIKGTGEMSDYDEDTSLDGVLSPWRSYNDGEIEDQIGLVVIGDGVTSIGEFAFAELKQLSGVLLPNTLTEIRSFAFLNCKNLTEFIFPKSVTSFGDYIFGTCNSIRSVTFLGNAPEGVFNALPFYNTGTVNYTGSGFEEIIEQYPDINWIKQ